MSSYLRVLRHPNFRYLFYGQSASAVGDQAVIVALALYVTGRGGSASELGFVLCAQAAPMIALLLLGGVWADRMARQRLMLVSDVARMALHGVLAASILTGGAGIAELIVIEALFGVARAFFQPAYTGLIPETVPPALLQDAQALSRTTANLAILVGPALGRRSCCRPAPGRRSRSTPPRSPSAPRCSREYGRDGVLPAIGP